MDADGNPSVATTEEVSLFLDLPSGAPIPPKLEPLARELITIRELLNHFEQTGDSRLMKDAAAKIKSNAPVIKELTADEKLKLDEIATNALKKCRSEMKTQFDRAKRVKSEFEERHAAEHPYLEKAKKEVLAENLQKAIKSGMEDKKREEQHQRELEMIEERKRELERREKEKADRKAELERERAEAEEEFRQEQERVHAEQLSKLEQQQQQQQEEKIVPDYHTELKPVEKMKRGPDIWSQILNELDDKGVDKNNTNEDYTLIFCGDKYAGKTTYINRVHERVEGVVPSTAMEYSYARRLKKFSTNQARDVLHTWEIAGGPALSNLFSACLTPQTVHATVVVICVDLSKPTNMLQNILAWIHVIKQTVEDCVRELRIKSNPNLSIIRKRAKSALPEDHPDKGVVRPVGIPVIVLGSKFDLYQDWGSTQRKVMSKALRFISHMHGCSLVFSTKDEEPLMLRFRSLLTHYLFHTRPSKNIVTDYAKPLFIPAGVDTLEQIGGAGASEEALQRSIDEAWVEAFPQTDTGETDEGFSLEDILAYAEISVDTMRNEKEKELERYKRETLMRQRASALYSAGTSPASQYSRSVKKQ